MNNSEVDNLATKLGGHLVRKAWQVTTAESCTGGGLAQAITSIAGSSQWFEQGFITYSDQAKQQQLKVSAKMLELRGAVSGPVVVAMATAALQRASADISVAISGIAGPGGGTEEKPVGTVWIAWSMVDGKHFSRLYQFSGSRYQIRECAIIEALKGLIMLIEKNTV
jgi:nicotinamide-nucleotide amidase